MGRLSALGFEQLFSGPVGETNAYVLHPRGRVGVIAETATGYLLQLGAILATGNTAVVESNVLSGVDSAALRSLLGGRLHVVTSLDAESDLQSILFEGSASGLLGLNQRIAARPGSILSVQARTADQLARGIDYNMPLLLEERSISTNTAAAGGNASLMSIG